MQYVNISCYYDFYYYHVIGQRARAELENTDFIVSALNWCPTSALSLELGKVEVKVFDPDSLDPDRCESCYGAETEDIKWARPLGLGTRGSGVSRAPIRRCLSAMLSLCQTLWQVGRLDQEFRGDEVCASVTDPGVSDWCSLPRPRLGPADLETRLKWSLLWFRGGLWSPTARFHPCVLGPSHITSFVKGDDDNTFFVRVTSGLNVCCM